MEVLTRTIRKTSTSHLTYASPNLTTFYRLDELGLEAVGQHLTSKRAVLECRVVEPDRWCQSCGAEGRVRDTVVCKLAHEPFGHRPTTLVIRVRRVPLRALQPYLATGHLESSRATIEISRRTD